jgi:hypothetical protein
MRRKSKRKYGRPVHMTRKKVFKAICNPEESPLFPL